MVKINPPPLNPNAPDFNQKLVEVIRLIWVKLMGADGSSVGLEISEGGTGADNASDARDNLGLTIGTDVQAHSAVLDATTASFTTADETKLDGIEASAQVNTVTAGNTLTFTSKTISLGSNTLTGTMAQFNTACSDGDFPFLGANNTFTGDNVFNGNVTLGDASADTLTINSGTWTIGSNYTATRAVGTFAAGFQQILSHAITGAGDAGGTSNVFGHNYSIRMTGSNAASGMLALSYLASNDSTNTLTNLRGMQAGVRTINSGNTTNMTALRGELQITGAGNVTNGICFEAPAPTLSSTGAFTTVRGFVSRNLGHATLTTNAISFDAEDITVNAFAVAYRSQMTAGTNKFGFYESGGANNYFAGKIGLGTSSPTLSGSGLLDMNADTFRLRTQRTPSSSGDTCNAGEYFADSNYLYYGKGTNDIVRIAWDATPF